MVGRPISFDRVLVADSDARIVAVVGQELRAAGFDVLEAFDGPGALDACMVHAPSLAIISYEMSSSTGIAHEIANRTSVPVVLMSTCSDAAVVREAVAAGVIGFLLQPVDARQLLPVVRIALQRARDFQALRSQISTGKPQTLCRNS